MSSDGDGARAGRSRALLGVTGEPAAASAVLRLAGEGGGPAAGPAQQPPRIGPVPRSSVLARAGAFLPQLAAANAELQSRVRAAGAASCDVEVLEDEAAPHVEMDLGLGVFELKTAQAVAAAERAIGGGGGGGGPTVAGEGAGGGRGAKRQRRKPGIEVIGGDDAS